RVAPGDGPACGPGRMADRWRPGELPGPDREVQGDRDRAGHGARRSGHGRGAQVNRHVARPHPRQLGRAGPHGTIMVLAKAPVPGRTKTRLCPPCTWEEAAWLAQVALLQTLGAVARTRASGRVLVLDGAPGPWLPPGLDVVGQRGDGLDE